MNGYQQSGWRAEVSRQVSPRLTGALAVYLWRKHADGSVDLMEPAELVVRNIPPGEPVPEAGPSLSLNDDVAMALLNALAAYFGGTSDVLRLQRDLTAERARVDRFIAYLTRGEITLEVPR